MELRCPCRSTKISETSRFENDIKYTYFDQRLFRQLKTRNAAFCPPPSHLSIGYAMLHCPRDIMRILIAFSTFSAISMASALAADPTGDWRVADGVATIRVAECNGSMWGVVTWEKEPGGRDENNPDVSKRSRFTLGMPILIDMKKKPGVDQWEGEVYNAKDGKTYGSTIKPTGSDRLEIQGCVLGFLCGGETWTRIAGPIPSSTANGTAKGAPKTPPKTTATANPTANPTAKMPGQKQAAATDTIGDICLIPDIARLSH
jgi:uncharacterized protein (DUF2147 family)